MEGKSLPHSLCESAAKADNMTGIFTKDSDPKPVDLSAEYEVVNDPISLMIDLIIFSPQADPSAEYYEEYAQARVNAYVFLRMNGIGGNPLDPLDIASCVEI